MLRECGLDRAESGVDSGWRARVVELIRLVVTLPFCHTPRRFLEPLDGLLRVDLLGALGKTIRVLCGPTLRFVECQPLLTGLVISQGLPGEGVVVFLLIAQLGSLLCVVLFYVAAASHFDRVHATLPRSVHTDRL